MAIQNKEFPSNLGVVDMDWLSTLGHTGTSGFGSRFAYVAGKILWFGLRGWKNKPDLSTYYNAFPDTNWRALAINDLMASGKVRPEEIFRPNQESKYVNDKRHSLDRAFKQLSSRQDQFRSGNTWPGFTIATEKQPNPFASSGLHNLFSPRALGGVDLSAAQPLEGLDELEGFQYDQTSGQLTLIARENRQLALSPLQLDDIVTVFKAVYAGRPPTITIDPDPEDTDGPTMLVIPSVGIEQTYVHWVLYQADRIMKSYGLGRDSLTAKKLRPNIPGYQEVLDSMFAIPPVNEQIRERFWILPDISQRYKIVGTNINLFDFPLTVQTRRITLDAEGKTRDLRGGESTPGALAFTAWFAQHMSEVGAVAQMLPPPERGTKPVNVFAELRRFAALTAIAEQARDDGVPLPAWMSRHAMTAVVVDQRTPALTESRSHEFEEYTTTVSIYGGAELSFERQSGQTVQSLADLHDLPPHVRLRGRQKLALLARLDRALADLPSRQGIVVETISDGENQYRAARFAGPGTRVVGRLDLPTTDISIPAGFLNLALQRNSDSSQPGLWGAGWALMLPQLSQSLATGRLKNNQRTVHRRYTLKWRDRFIAFSDLTDLPTLGANGYRPVSSNDPGGNFVKWLVRGRSPGLSAPTLQVHSSDGLILHFDDALRFVAYEQGSGESNTLIMYAWKGQRELTKITAMVGGRHLDALHLKYADGLLRRVYLERAQTEVVYSYANRMLAGVYTMAGQSHYTYTSGQLTAIHHNDQVLELRHDNAQRVVGAEFNKQPIDISYTISGNQQIASVRVHDVPLMDVIYADNNLPVEIVMTDGARLRVDQIGVLSGLTNR